MSSLGLKVELPDNKLYQRLLLADPLRPSTWRAINTSGEQKELGALLEADKFFEDTAATLGKGLDCIYISVAQEADGQHRFVNLGEARRVLKQQADQELPLLGEAEAKALMDNGKGAALFARPAEEAAAQREQPYPQPGARLSVAARAQLGMKDEFTPKASQWSCNYDVIPDLSLGLTQRMILCDEATLTRSLPSEKIFDYLCLIVNCHENNPNDGKYRIGTCSTDRKPCVIYQAVHGWHGANNDEMNKRNDMMQQAMWENLQKGSVAVHCLAGIHRAACIVACHFLYRHYALGHTDIPADPKEIYRRLKAARPHVDAAYAHVLRSYEAHLQKQHQR